MAFSRPSLRSVLTSLVPVALLIAAGTVWLSKGRLVGPSAPAVSLYRRHILQSEAAEAKPVIAQTVFNLYGPATSELDPSILEKMLVSLAGSAGVSAAASSLNIVNDAPYSFQLHFSFTSDSITATSAQEKVASAIGALPRDIGLVGNTASKVSQAIVDNPSGSLPSVTGSSNKKTFPIWTIGVIVLLTLLVIFLFITAGCLLHKRRVAQRLLDVESSGFIVRPYSKVFVKSLPTSTQKIEPQSPRAQFDPAVSPPAESPYRKALREEEPIKAPAAAPEPSYMPRRLSHMASISAI